MRPRFWFASGIVTFTVANDHCSMRICRNYGPIYSHTAKGAAINNVLCISALLSIRISVLLAM